MADEALDTSTETSTESSTTETNTDSTQSGSFFSALSKENQAHPNAEKFRTSDTDTVFKSYNEATSMIGRDKIVRPDFGSEADVKRFYSEMGVPDSVEGYEMGEVPDWAKEAGYDNTLVKNIALKHNLTPDQAKGVEADYLEDAQATMQRNAKEAEDLKGSNDQLLRTEMGEKYESNMAMKDAVIDKFARTPETAQALKALADSNPLVAASLSDMAGKFSEHTLGELQPKTFAISPQEAQDKVDALRSDMDSPYWKDDDRAAHNKAVDEVLRLETYIAGAKKG